jgi:hypothetical protein
MQAATAGGHTVAEKPGSHIAADSPQRYQRLRIYNALMGLFHFVQGVVILVLATDFTLPVTATFPAGPPGTPPSSPTTLFDVSIAWGVAAFFFLSAIAHWMVSLVVFPWYVNNLKLRRNYARWIEYAVSSTVMVILIALLPGITEFAALIGLATANVSMILFGLLQEKYENPGSRGWLPFIFGCITGIAPWFAIGFYIWAPGSTAEPPGFVYAIFVSLFVFFNAFALNQWLQYKQVGKWRDYLFGEATYITLSLVAKSALAWQVFAGTLNA